MIKTRSVLFAIILIYFSSSCIIDPNKQVDEGKVNNNKYTSQNIGWTIQIPAGWEIMLKDQLDINQEKGMEIVQEAVETDFDYSGLKHLICFQKNRSNIFQSTSEPFELEYSGHWEDNNKLGKQLIVKAYQSQGINIDTSSTKAHIDNITFDVFKIKLSDPEGKLILNQDIYSSLINNYIFSVILSYNRLKDKEEMMEVWKNSKFEK